uniref:DUF659 domain-containing protein n=1 Tax=Rhodnius prolixus TaxID=13249 RepID=T1H901_RHOPR
MPDENTLRKNYLEDIYKDTLTKIREHIKDGPIWVSINETTDVEGRYIANAVIGKLDSDADVDSKPFLLNCEVLEKCNHSTISRFFDASMHILWPSGVLNEKVLLFLSDAAPNMVKAGQSIQVFYPKIIHVTCIAHALHRVAETVRSLFSDVDSLISSVKKVFLKAPSRIKMLKDLYPDLCLPPEPILTRWGTWLEAAQYYYENYNKIKNVLSHLGDEAVAINTAKSLFEKPNLRNDLAFISDNCVFLGQAITQLESQNVRLTENVSNVKKVIEKVEGIPGSKGDLIRSKLVEVLSKNKGWETICQISDIISGTEVTSEHRVPFTTNEITSFSKAPTTSVDVERSFSRYKSILRPDRRHFTFQHLKFHVVANNFEE